MNPKLFFLDIQIFALGLGPFWLKTNACETEDLEKNFGSITAWFFVTKALVIYLSIYLYTDLKGEVHHKQACIFNICILLYVFCFVFQRKR